MITKKIQELNLKKLKGFESWCYEGDSYEDKEGNGYCVVDSEENKDLEECNLPKGIHLYRIETGEIENDVSLILVV